jgi:hypothetical protein
MATKKQASTRTTRSTAGGKLEDRTRQELYEQAKKKGIAGRSKMSKTQLVAALRRSR